MAPARRRFKESDDEDGGSIPTRSGASSPSLPDLGLDLGSSLPSTQRKNGESERPSAKSGLAADHSTESGSSDRPSERPSAPPPPALPLSDRNDQNSPPLSSLPTTTSSSDSKRADTQPKPADSEPKGQPLDMDALSRALLDQVGIKRKEEVYGLL